MNDPKNYSNEYLFATEPITIFKQDWPRRKENYIINANPSSFPKVLLGIDGSCRERGGVKQFKLSIKVYIYIFVCRIDFMG